MSNLIPPELLTGAVIIPFFLGLISVLLLYWYYTRNFDYWEKRGITYCQPIPFFGSTVEVLWKPFHEIEYERYFRLGKLYGHFEGNRPLLSVADPKLLREIFVKEFGSFPNRRHIKLGNAIADSMLPALEGDDWKRVRSIVSPTFTTGKIRRMMSIVKDCSQVVIHNLKSKHAAKERPFNAKEIYGAFSLDVIASSAFSTKLDSLNEPENEFVKAARSAFSTDFSWRFAVYQLFPNLMKMLKIHIFPAHPLEFFKKVTLQIIEQRKKTGQTRNDFLQLLMDTAKETVEQDQEVEKEEGIASNYKMEESSSQPIKNISNKNLSADELVGQCVIFFIAGYDTTAATLSMTSYLLALHPEIQDKLHKEIKEVLQQTKGELTYEAIQEMKYLDNVIAETLRLYPPVNRLERVADADFKLADTGITIPKGMIVTIPNYAIHRDPKIFLDPEEYNPDRFSAEEKAKREQYTYLPFGAGPRNCVGMRFALMEIKVCLAYVVANFKLQRCPQTKVPLEFHLGPGILMNAKQTILKVSERTDKIIFK
ncbi:cytochrome P450 3A11 [Caerostris extrusa]|uniref:Cytochrome P450 3A11 n=1 Tax=Caerostris extrusa TaxID=172846 RepID=A0AAV4TS43_CAEEX|nr:cytochrome P450 3A11 [Caerostris extrusa]